MTSLIRVVIQPGLYQPFCSNTSTKVGFTLLLNQGPRQGSSGSHNVAQQRRYKKTNTGCTQRTAELLVNHCSAEVLSLLVSRNT